MKTRKPLVINLLSGPGAGKSTTRAMLFAHLKLKHYEVEEVTEYAKSLVYEERQKTFEDQFYLAGKQNHRMEILRGVVDFIVTDCPIILSSIYTPENYHIPNFKQFIMGVHHSYDNLNIFIKRVKKYNPNGRNQKTIDEARAVDLKILKFLNDNDLSYHVVDGDEKAAENISEIIKKIT
jgi:hypothetical protein